MRNLHIWLNYLTIGALALWWGGFTFYAGIVIPVSTEIVGVTVQGFITQHVSDWLNAIGGITLILLGIMAFRTPKIKNLSRWWILLLLTWITLLILHPVMDNMLDETQRVILNKDHFYGWHQVYLWVSTLQWAGMIGAGVVLIKSKDR